MNKFFLRGYGRAALATAGLVGFGSAQAAIDTTSITQALTDAGAAAAVVGAAVLVVIVGIKAFKYVKQAM